MFGRVTGVCFPRFFSLEAINVANKSKINSWESRGKDRNSARSSRSLSASTSSFLWWLGALDPSRLRFNPASATNNLGVDPRDRALMDKLLALMDAGEAVREPSLTIDHFAKRLSAPTHRLRALIHRGLGFRNFASFASFANQYRLAHAKTALADPDRGRGTILAIAFDGGFPSLQTFNRVFHQSEGVTQTEHRRLRLGASEIAAETANPLRN